MNKTIRLIVLIPLLACSCSRDPGPSDLILGKWKSESKGSRGDISIEIYNDFEYTKNGKYIVNQNITVCRGDKSAKFSTEDIGEWKIENGVFFERTVGGKILESSGDEDIINTVKGTHEKNIDFKWDEWNIIEISETKFTKQLKDISKDDEIHKLTRP